MPSELVHPSFLNFVRSLKPYMGPTALQYTELVENLVDLLSTEQAQKIQNSFLSLKERKATLKETKVTNTVIPESSLNLSKELNLETSKESREKGLYSREPFLLFLILILLILSFEG